MTIGASSGVNLVVFLLVGTILFLFGFLYNLSVSWLERRGYDEGYTSLLVVIGVSVTLVGVAVIDARAAAITLAAFACSGFWMVVGSWWRYVNARKRGQDGQRDQAA